MRSLLHMAWRSVWRHRRRTILTIASIAGALSVAVFFLAIADGMYGRLLHDVLRMQAGHLTVENAQHLEAPAIDLTVEGVSDLRRRIDALPGVAATKELVVGQGVVGSAQGTVATAIVGVQPTEEAAMSPLVARLTAGTYLEADDDRAAVIGAEMARRLEADVGTRLVLYTNDTHGQMVQQMVRVKGVFETGSSDIDGHYLQVPIGFARTVFAMNADEATEIGILLANPDQQEKVLSEVESLVAGDDRLAVWPWERIMPELSTFMTVDKGSNDVLQFIILMLAMFTIFNTILMSALERKREFAVMLALGTPSSRVAAQLLVESLLLGLVGCVVGVLVGVGVSLATDGVSLASSLGGSFEVGGFIVNPVLRVKLSWRITLGLGAAMLGAMALMAVVPMFRIRRIRVTDAFR